MNASLLASKSGSCRRPTVSLKPFRHTNDTSQTRHRLPLMRLERALLQIRCISSPSSVAPLAWCFHPPLLFLPLFRFPYYRLRTHASAKNSKRAFFRSAKDFKSIPTRHRPSIELTIDSRAFARASLSLTTTSPKISFNKLSLNPGPALYSSSSSVGAVAPPDGLAFES